MANILIVEDEPDIRETLRLILETVGYSATEAANGREAIDLLKSGPPPPCVILLDLMMPVMDGWQFIDELAKIDDPSLRSVAVVVITALGDRADVLKTKSAVRAIIKKPIDLNVLLETIQKYCQKRDD